MGRAQRLWTLSAGCLGFAAGQVLPLVVTPEMRSTLIWVGGGFLLAALLLAAFAAGAQRSAAVSRSRSHSDRVYVTQAPAKIARIARVKMELHSAPLIEAYVGKWIRFSGRVSDVSKEGVTAYRLAPSMDWFRVFVRAEGTADAWRNHLPLLERGERVSFEGRIKSVHSLGLTLVDAAFVEE